MTESTIVRENLMTVQGYTPYCGAVTPPSLVMSCSNPRTKLKNMKTDNELIAEFMGMGIFHYNPNQLGYDTSWDWLIPVVEKIHNVVPSEVSEVNNEGLAIFEIGLLTPIGEVHEAVVQFIKWYNSNHDRK